MANHTPSPRSEKGARPPELFQYAVSAQLFLSICFALALSGSLLLVDFALKETGKLHVLFCLPLSLLVLLLVWRQYGLYYLPVQHYRQCADTLFADLVTLIITVSLGALPILCARAQPFVPLSLFLIVGLTLRKVNELMVAIGNDGAGEIGQALSYLRKQLINYLCWVGILSAAYWTLRVHWGEVTQSAMMGGMFLFGYLFARWSFVDVFGPRRQPQLVINADLYNEAVRVALLQQMSKRI